MSEIGQTNEQGRVRSSRARHSTLMRQATSLAERGMYDEAIDHVKQAMALCPQDPQCSVQLASIYRAQKRIGQAIEAMRRAVELDPRNPALQEQLLKTLIETEHYDEAARVGRRLLEQSPRNMFARDILGIVYLQKGMLDNALRMTDELIRLDPTDAAHFFKKAVLLQQKGQIAEAMEAFHRSLETDPDGEMADDARDAIAALDSYQLRQVLTIAVEDPVFRAKIALDPDAALAERGYRLSNSGIATLRQICMEGLPQDVQSRYYH